MITSDRLVKYFWIFSRIEISVEICEDHTEELYSNSREYKSNRGVRESNCQC